MALGSLTCLTGCGTSAKQTSATSEPQVIQGHIDAGEVERPIGGSVNALPMAHIYRMNGDYAGNVPIQMDAQGQIISFPAPGDLSENSKPIKLSDGWWLDRRGVGLHSVFTSYTYAEYMALPSAPSLAELKAHIIPGSGITQIAELPMRPGEAVANIKAVDSLIKNGLPGCNVANGLPLPATRQE